MKKSFLAAIVAFIALVCCFAVAGCNDSASGSHSGVSVALNERYIRYYSKDKPAEEQTYYIFLSDTEGEYHNYSSTGIDYIVYFRYEIVGDTLYGFYDSVEYGDRHTQSKNISTRWTLVCTPSENFLYQGSGEPWFNENYLKNTIPNYGSGENV